MKLKPISQESIPAAIEKAIQYRLLNDPWHAESICRDILAIDYDHQEAVIQLILALTDQFESDSKLESEAKSLCDRLNSDYKKLYYRGLISERMGTAALMRSTPRVKYIAYECYKKAMEFYEKAEKIHPEDNDESILRWNACLRTIDSLKLKASPNTDERQPLLDV